MGVTGYLGVMDRSEPVRRELRLEHGLRAVPAARRGIQSDLAVLPLDRRLVQDVSTVVSELVSNAVRHGVADEDGEVRVGWRVADDRLEVTVRDAGGLGRPQMQHPAPDASGGRGLLLVDALSGGWWVDSADGMRVTAVFALPHAV